MKNDSTKAAIKNILMRVMHFIFNFKFSALFGINNLNGKVLPGSVDLSRLDLQQFVWYLGKAEPMWCGYSP